MESNEQNKLTCKIVTDSESRLTTVSRGEGCEERVERKRKREKAYGHGQ